VQPLSFDKAVDLARAAACCQRRVVGRDHSRALAAHRAPGCPTALGLDRDDFTKLQTEFGFSLLLHARSLASNRPGDLLANCPYVGPCVRINPVLIG